MTDLAGKIIVVTGGASGIGLATVERLAGLGAVLVVGDLGAEPSPALQKLITRYDEGLSYAPLDVSSRESAHRFMEAVMNKHGRVDGLVNNAGICPNEGEMASDELYDRIMAVNLKGVWHMGTEAITVMKNQTASEGVKGVIVNTASDAALKGIRGIAAYTASKHGVLGLTRTWCKDWTPVGIRVNAVAPG
jgi:NAD(P)-dependent dehydrogenase (short-subunit alcohol dehydrogenase family)